MTSLIARTLTEAAHLLDSSLSLPGSDIEREAPATQFELPHGMASDATRLHDELVD